MGRPQNVIKPKPVAPSSWTAPIALWIATLHASNLSPRYIADARAFITRAAAAWAVAPDDVTLAHLLEWSTRGVKASTMATERSFIRSFFSLLWEEGMISRDPSRRLPRVKVRAGKPRPLTVEQVELMGHHNPATTMRYTEVDHTQAGIALASIPSLSDEVYPTASIIPVLEQLRENGPRASMHGSNAAYRKGCRCSECRSGHAAANARWRENRAARQLAADSARVAEDVLS